MKDELMGSEETLAKSDTDLVLEFKEGREHAFDELVERHMNKAIQFAYVVVGNYEDAKDVSQEAFVKAYRSLKQFRLESKFSTWFYRVLMNAAKDFLRKRSWKRFLKWERNESMERFFESVEDKRTFPGKELLGEELGRKMTCAITRLPFKQRCVFNLRFIEGLSIQEICEATDLAEGTVKATLHFAVRKFKDALNPYLAEGRR